MKLKTLVLILILVLGLFGCKGGNEKASKFINGAGASFPYILYANWANEYYKLTGIKVNYQSIGSGGGIKQIIEKTVDFGATDKPLTPKEVEDNKLLQFPTVIGGVVPVVNLPELKDKSLVLDGKTLCYIFLGKIKKFNDQEIKKLNPDINLPDKEILVVYRADGSGTTAIFTYYLSQVCAEWKKEVGTGTSVSWKTGVGAKGNEGVSNYVKKTPYTIGYIEYAYAVQNKLSMVSLKNAQGVVVSPSEESFKEAARAADLDPKKHFYVWLTNTPGEKAWPITGVTYILLSKEKGEVNKEVVKFFEWAFKQGDEIAKKLTYVPLPEEVKTKIYKYWEENGVKP
ncbi:phosphate ABC transporter substrate-binding protein PstS [Thermodesulfobacterium sp. TA1]|uniref:phosphate ABC transporter substrate-binding protein PstS n=1 Tax=Thermodesulfobacterium sp. TA1 TaxID=2234087 RepID=UPI001231AC13|nr:phosphate ABC transporter substrate-binding protein PstS [Thermodesulfobacterium sp. TA1]QER41284.1 phosphate ABC transporter substrate-binding protein PstS [Thermodesulfobacterium sp. TA1]